jgi:transposase-like protein
MPALPLVPRPEYRGRLERNGEVRTAVISNTKRRSLHGEVNRHVEAGSTVYSDALRSYNQLDQEYVHHVINHAVEYVRGHVHTNGIENFWSLLKRSLKGT